MTGTETTDIDNTRCWPHYRDAALKHYYALKKMQEELCSIGSANSIEYESMLCDAFYISGYIFEGASVYTIFKHMRWKRNIEIPIKSTEYDRLFDSANYKSGRCFFSAAERSSGTVGDFFKQLRGHLFQEYTKDQKTGYFEEPFFNGDFDNSCIPQRLKDWNPDKRYFCKGDYQMRGISISISDISEILEFCETYIIPILNGFKPKTIK